MSESQVAHGLDYLDTPLIIFVIGASGDLAKKKTYPSLFSLFCYGNLPKKTHIVGYARSKKSNEDFRAGLDSYLKLSNSHHTAEKKKEFLDSLTYFAGGYDDGAALTQLSNEMDALYPSGPCNRLFYFAIPPNVFVPIGKNIKANGLTERGWNRLIIEKPFGHDLESFRELQSDMGGLFTEDQIYRIDHYLGKEMVQNLLVMRFTNQFLEPIWNREHVNSVTITFKENFGTQGRGGYFDNFGIIRDVMQNHLLQVMSLVAMEPPVQASGQNYSNYVRDQKVQVLNAIEPIKIDDVITGQYIMDPENPNSEPGYLEDPTVPDNSVTPTYCTAVMYVNNPRWAGVPFIMKAGKALNERKSEVRIQFKTPAATKYMFPNTEVEPNEFVMRLQPDEAVYMKQNIKEPGLKTMPVVSQMDLTYKESFPDELIPDAYTRLILDVLRGRQAAFVRDDELEAAWKIFSPLLHQLDAEQLKPIPYKFGSRGPAESDRLTERLGYKYHNGKYQYRRQSFL